jgi:hypothetical protein
MRELNRPSNPFSIKRKEKKDETREIFSLFFNDSDPFGRVICRMQTPNRYDVQS